MKIFTEIKDSIYNPEYYRGLILDKPRKESIKYLAKLSFILALITVVAFTFSFPKLITLIKSEISTFTKDYPEDMVLSIDKGNVSINKPEPYIIPIPTKWEELKNDKSINPENIIVINTTEPFSLEKFNDYSTVFLITKNNLISQQPENKEIKIMPLSEIGDLNITKSWVLEKEALILKILPFVMALIIPLGVGVLFLGNFVGSLIVIFLYALFVWLLFKIKKMDITYKKSYQVALHASTLILILGLLNYYFDFFNNIFIKLILIILVVYLNIFVNREPLKEKEEFLFKKDEDKTKIEINPNQNQE